MTCLLKIAALTALTLICSCQDAKVPPGRIMVKNDFQDKEYNVLSVSGGGAYYSLNPGERVLLPERTTSISFSRRYRDFTRQYKVECPANLKKGISIKLIDVHVNRIAGGCKTVWSDKG